MTPEDYRLIGTLFGQLRELPESRYAAFLDATGLANNEIREEVLRLLEADHVASGDSFLGGRAVDDAAELLAQSPSLREATSQNLAGIEIGRYRLIEAIAEGGMGEVWLAEQLEPVRRRVALKLVRAGMTTRAIIARFDSERQALALMEHPAIAKVFDAGTAPDGRPYFVMEYVHGVPITTYCDECRLSTRERLELFIRVCEGVHHAHQKAIIHRDLKPSNILVAEVDGRAAPKIIDFGVAKALTQKLTADTLFTQAGVLVGTPAYMSPEQAGSAGEDIDTRSDVYSLGTVLYELLSGVAPLDPTKLSLDEFLRRVRLEDPPKPSTRIRMQEPATSEEVARRRGVAGPQHLVKQIRGDLDWIALKAVEKDRSRRYGSCSELAGDLRRYLNNESVLAVPPSAAYRARKFARRHRAALAAACAILLTLLVAAIVSIRQTIRADAESAVAQAVNDFLQNDMLAQASAASQALEGKPDPDLKVRTALDRAAARLDGKFGRQPEVEAAIRDTIGQTYFDLGLNQEARKQTEQALTLYRRVLGPENRNTIEATNRLAAIAFRQGMYTQAEMQHAAIVQASRRRLGPEHRDTLVAMAGLAQDYRAQGKYAQAEKLQSDTLEAQRRVLGLEHPDTVKSLGDLAVIYYQQGKFAEAEALYNQTLAIDRRTLGREHPTTLRFMNNLALALYQQGKYAEAEDLERETLEIDRRVLGSGHQFTLNAINNLANDKSARGEYAEAEALYTEAIGIQQRVLGPEHPETLVSMGNLAAIYFLRGQTREAETLFDATLQAKRRVLGDGHASTLYTISYLGFVCQRQSKYRLAESYAAQALAGRRQALGAENRDTVTSEADLALALVSQKKFAKSEPFAREALVINRKKRPEDWQRFRAETLLGVSLAGEKRYAEAEPLLINGYRGMAALKEWMKVEDWYHLDRAREWIAQLHVAQNVRGGVK
jgi:eukaryotic-like serine/threonine-protein kinase